MIFSFRKSKTKTLAMKKVPQTNIIGSNAIKSLSEPWLDDFDRSVVAFFQSSEWKSFRWFLLLIGSPLLGVQTGELQLHLSICFFSLKVILRSSSFDWRLSSLSPPDSFRGWASQSSPNSLVGVRFFSDLNTSTVVNSKVMKKV